MTSQVLSELRAVADTANHSPWWGVPLIAGGFAFVGILLAQTVTLVTHRRNVAREDSRRWDSERRNVYAEVLRYARTCASRLELLSSWDTRSGFAEAHDELRSSVDEAQLVASEKVAAAAQHVLNIVGLLVLLPESVYPVTETHVAASQVALKKGTEAFLDEARIELGITPPPTPERTTLLHATDPKGILREASRAAFEIQRGASATLFGSVNAAAALVGKGLVLVLVQMGTILRLSVAELLDRPPKRRGE